MYETLYDMSDATSKKRVRHRHFTWGRMRKKKYFKKMSISFQQIKNKYLNSIFICNYECTQLVLNPSTSPSTLHFIRGEVSIWARANCSPPTPPTPPHTTICNFFPEETMNTKKKKIKEHNNFQERHNYHAPGLQV